MSLGGIIDTKRCPLGKFEILGGSYTSDPVECCFDCNFADCSVKEFDLSKICKCPAEKMSIDDYNNLKKEFLSLCCGNPAREDFWEFARKKYS